MSLTCDFERVCNRRLHFCQDRQRFYDYRCLKNCFCAIMAFAVGCSDKGSVVDGQYSGFDSSGVSCREKCAYETAGRSCFHERRAGSYLSKGISGRSIPGRSRSVAHLHAHGTVHDCLRLICRACRQWGYFRR